jgi:hypothetical protein
MKHKKFVLVSTLKLAKPEKETHTTPWGRVWTSGSDVLATWKRTGWIPPSEYRDDYFFKTNRLGGVSNDQ